jgi:hypothetical protein
VAGLEDDDLERVEARADLDYPRRRQLFAGFRIARDCC